MSCSGILYKIKNGSILYTILFVTSNHQSTNIEQLKKKSNISLVHSIYRMRAIITQSGLETALKITFSNLVFAANNVVIRLSLNNVTEILMKKLTLKNKIAFSNIQIIYCYQTKKSMLLSAFFFLLCRL